MKKVYGYIRVSSTRQGDGASLPEQRSAIEQYARSHDFEIVEWFEELETASVPGRPAFNRMLRLLRLRRADGCVIHKIDRSMRNHDDWAQLRRFQDSGIEVHFAAEGLDLNTPIGQYVADIQAANAVHYSRNLKEEVKKGFYGRLKQGLYPMPAPVGYLDAGGGKPKIPDPVKGPLVQELFQRYAKRGFTVRELKSEAARIGLRNRNNGVLSVNAVNEILKNSFYAGLISIRKRGETYPGVHQPLIQPSLFKQVQDLLAGRCQRRTQGHEFRFTRLVKCAHCGRHLIGETHKGHNYYRCQSRLGCPVTCVREEVLDAEVATKLAPLQMTPEENKYLTRLVDEQTNDDKETRRRLVGSLKLQKDQIDERMRRLIDAYIDRALEKQLFEERKTALLMESREIAERLIKSELGSTKVAERVRYSLELAGDAYLQYETGLAHEKRELLEIVTSNRTVRGKTPCFTLDCPFDLIAKRAEVANGGARRDTHRTCELLLQKLMDLFSSSEQNDGPKRQVPGDSVSAQAA